MKKSFTDTLPADLLGNIRSMCGSEGEVWLRELPERIAKLERIWKITAGEVFASAGINYVAPAIADDGDRLVVKISPPYDNTEFISEAAYLRSRAGRGCVRLVADSRDDRAMLIERAVPGETLDALFAGREPECVPLAIDLLKEITENANAPGDNAIDLDDWFENLRRSEGTDFPFEYSRKALYIYERYRRPARTYIHGDFHLKNIVSATREPYLMIDPKGLIGDVGYDIGVFLNNFHWWQDEHPDLKPRLAVAARQFADGIGISESEVRGWAFAQMVVAAWWTFDELSDQYDDDVSMADIWGV